MLFTRTSFAVLLLVICVGRIGHAQQREAERWSKPIRIGKDAATAVDAGKYVFDYNIRTTVDAYEDVGSADGKWKDEAIEFLTEVARHFSTPEGYKLPKGYKSREELVAMAEPLLEVGCDDPLVQYCYGALLQDSTQNEKARARGFRYVEGSYPRLVERGYPADRLFYTARRIWKELSDQKAEPEEIEKYFELAWKHALQMVLLDDLEGNDGRTLYSKLNGWVTTLSLEVREEFCMALKQHAAESSYVVEMLVGDYHMAAGWDARGSGFANEVTREGWEDFETHMQLARKSFENAWEAAPHRPEAPAAMVYVAMCSSRSANREMRRWFERAVEAQCDYRVAYTNVLQGLMPRWHGSLDQLYQFGVSCSNTERYDTLVPYMLFDVLWRIVGDKLNNSEGIRYLRKPGIYDNVRSVCQGYLEHENDLSTDEWWKTAWLGFACCAEQWDDAKRLIEELDSDLDADALARFPLEAEVVVSLVEINTSPHADAIARACHDADAGRWERARLALEEVLSANDLSPRLAESVNSQLQGIKWTIEFAKGESVNLLPESNLYGWRSLSGKWTRTEDDKITGVSTRSGVVLESQIRLGTYWELSGELTHGESPYDPWSAGVFIRENSSPSLAIMFNPTGKWVGAGLLDRIEKHKKPFKPAGKTTKFVVRLEGDFVNVWLNGTLVIEDQEVDGLGGLKNGRLSIGAAYTWEGSTLIYENLKIKKIVPET